MMSRSILCYDKLFFLVGLSRLWFLYPMQSIENIRCAEIFWKKSLSLHSKRNNYEKSAKGSYHITDSP